jgi:hypothetical protein
MGTSGAECYKLLYQIQVLPVLTLLEDEMENEVDNNKAKQQQLRMNYRSVQQCKVM